MKRNTRDRLLARLDRSGACWLWTGYKNSTNGYAQMSVGGRPQYVHRLSYEIHKGPIPGGMVVDHTCRVRHCANPLHLEAVTPAENLRRALGQIRPAVAASNRRRGAARTHCPHGHELTEENTYRETKKNGNTLRRCRTCRKAERSRKRAH